MAARLRQIMTEETRTINPKYGKMTMEYNATRWLIFSNHDDALPIPEDDRRFEVVANPREVQSAAYYRRLYSALDDHDFIAGIAHFLATRDISHYDHGARPQLTEAKKQVINASVPQIEQTARQILAEWKVAGLLMFASRDLLRLAEATQAQAATFHHVLKRMRVVRISTAMVNGLRETRFAVDKQAYLRLANEEGLMEAAWARVLEERGEGGLMYSAAGPGETRGTF
jgi:hypothetical protein